jgi:hypothetical protein
VRSRREFIDAIVIEELGFFDTGDREEIKDRE